MNRRAWTLAALAAAGCLLTLHAGRLGFLADDAFIFLRYARNLLDGHGLVYNPGERVEGYSSPLFTLLVAGVGALGADLVLAARSLSLVAALATLLAASRLATRLVASDAPLASLPALLLAAHAPFACWALAGMDAPLYALLATLALALLPEPEASAAKRAAYGCLLGLLLLTRSEAWLVGFVGCAALLLRDGARRLPPTLVPMLAIAMTHLLWRHAYYGDWLPNTYFVKVGRDLDQLVRGIGYVLDYAQAFGAGPLVLLPFAAVLWRRDVAWLATAAAAVLMVAGVAAVGGDGLPMYRFLVPVVPLWAALWAALLADGLRAARAWRPDAASRLAAAAGGLALLVALSAARPPASDPQVAIMRDQRDREIPDWSAAGLFLRGEARPGDAVALAPIGAVGYYSGLTVIDMLGLVDRHIARREMPPAERRWTGHEKHDGAYVLSRRPRFLLLGNVRVLSAALPPDHPQFVRTGNPWIEAREGDVFADPERLQREYAPRVARLANGRYLHFLERREDASPR
ncbi:MAG: hypothetical protein AB7O37_23190 [Vicinamibacteria bacterium]